MGEAITVIGTAITTLGLIAVAIIRQGGQARESKRAGVESKDVHAQAAAVPPDPSEGWERLVQRLEARVSRLDDRIEKVEEEIKVERDAKWDAVRYIRILHEWIATHMPGARNLPSMPASLAMHVDPPESYPRPANSPNN